MKRSFLILLMSVVVLLTACRSDPPVLRDEFTLSVKVSGGAIDFTGELDRRMDTVTLTLTSPASVAGICYICSGGELTTSYGELSCITPDDSLPSSAAPAILCEATSRLNDAAYDSSEDGLDVYKLRLSAGEATLSCCEGMLQSIEIDSSPYLFTFSSPS